VCGVAWCIHLGAVPLGCPGALRVMFYLCGALWRGGQVMCLGGVPHAELGH
jgi:hypothetical protein